jgi:uncharacterized membrane protein
MHALNLWLHVVGFAVYLGSTLTILLAFLPLVRAIADPSEKRRIFARGMRVYNPLSLGAIGVSLMTGAFNLTDYKASLGKSFFSEVGSVLVWKLIFVFLLIMVATALSFGIAHRTVREELLEETVNDAALESRLRRLPAMLWMAVALTGVVIWLGLAMPRSP